MLNEVQIYIFIILAVLNLFGFVLVGIDKRQSFNQNERTPEVYFFLIAVLFASLGVFLGMFVFHHKTRKFYFPLGIGILLLEQAVLVAKLLKLI
jgi:uncharacterized membrane protein YsdA (DUF1294 family)